ncbi:hypothetical protein NFJ02_14g16780 [Pycnococcus provasolii]
MAAVAQEPPEIVALRLQLQIAEAQRDQAVAEAQGRAVAPVGQQPVQLNYLLPRDFEEVVSADLFPRDGVGRQGAVNPLRLDNDLAITEYSRRKSKHQVWTYRRSRTAGAYLELVVSALGDVIADGQNFEDGLAPLAGEDAAAWRNRIRPVLAQRSATLDRTLNTATGILSRLNELNDFLYVKGAPDYAIAPEKRAAVEALFDVESAQAPLLSDSAQTFSRTFDSDFATAIAKAAAKKAAGTK